MNQEEIKSIIPFAHNNGIHIVRKTGNNAAHYGSKVTAKDALISIKYMYGFLLWFADTYSKVRPELPGKFNEEFIPKIGAKQRQLNELEKEREQEQSRLKAQIDELLKEKEAILEKAQHSEMAYAHLKQKEEEAREQLNKQKAKRKVNINSEFTEAETRIHLIDVDLKEAGWINLREGRELEYPVVGMPVTADNPRGNGLADYVLWDDNGLPLAIIEAKRTSKNAEVGKHQAFLYAGCLEKMHKQRPVIFYSNGYETRIWDDTFYSTPRRVYGFYTKEELQWLIQQRTTRKDIRKATINRSIVERPYQIEAIQRISEDFVTDHKGVLRGNKRSGLLVMATGSGKTRTAAAIVDVLFKNNWAKRVLFLADRNALVQQAKNSFAEHLPELSSIDLTEDKENDTTRLVFSTYPSMMNKIDNVRTSHERFYGVGHFDLIIIDEAHRSVYNRYQAIFEYFDALIVGLTATPKDSIDHNTYELLGCSTDDPTFAFELNEAVPTYLCPFKNIGVTTDFLREGIKYKQLAEKDKQKYEDTFEDKTTGLFPEEISSNAMNKWLFNKDTVNKVLDVLMSHGLRIEGGDKLGRTIIFAVNQKHAQFIEDCFTERYPEQPSGFISSIHNKVSHSLSLIEAFCDHHNENNPQIAVSVDMMDTGIDAPRVLNLVFFKVVRSYAKFWQMIGRGTRLCPDVFGPDQPKAYFQIIDVCQNFEFFDVNKKGNEDLNIKPITRLIFESRLQISQLLKETSDKEDLELANELLDILHSSIQTLDRSRFQVKMNLRHVDEYHQRHRWNNLNADDHHIIEEYLSGLPVPEVINETARRFDLMMLKLQLSILLMNGKKKSFVNNLVNIANELSGKYTIPVVALSMPLIESMKDPDFYNELSQRKLDNLREEIRELVQYLDQKSRKSVYTDIQDSEVNITDGQGMPTYESNTIYRKRVESFIRENKNILAISKLINNQPITLQELKILEEVLFDGQERGTHEKFVKEYGNEPLGKFIRSILGLDQKVASEAFSYFLQTATLRADQMTFINNIITYLTKNGTIDKKMLFEPPFTDVNDQGLLGVFDTPNSTRIIRIIDEINENANVG
jgi:type I restriction enzyme R subunit